MSLVVAMDIESDNCEQIIDEYIQQLDLSSSEMKTYIRQILAVAGKLADDGASTLELKIITNALKEIRYGFKLFQEYRETRKIAVFGSARTEPDESNYRMAESFSKNAADSGYMLISGAGPGIMEAVNKGAGAENSFGLNIQIPFEGQSNKYIEDDPKCMTFRYFFSRKLLFSKESEAIVYFPGGFGTHDELFELLCLMQTGRHHLAPLILCDSDGYWAHFIEYLEDVLLENGTIGSNDLHLFDYVNSASEALEIIENFYSNYHSSRFVDEEYLIRFHGCPSGNFIGRLDEQFGSLCPESGFELIDGPVEGEEEGIPDDLYRLRFRFTNHDYGLLRLLVDEINSWDR